jgi:large subunit ribosomal protein L32
MPNPKRKHTRSRRDSRRASNWRLDLGTASACPHCKRARASHQVCPHCGFYGAELVIPKKEKKSKAGPEEKAGPAPQAG